MPFFPPNEPIPRKDVSELSASEASAFRQAIAALADSNGAVELRHLAQTIVDRLDSATLDAADLLGTWDSSGALPAVEPAGKWYQIVGDNAPYVDGGRLASNGTAWTQLPPPFYQPPPDGTITRAKLEPSVDAALPKIWTGQTDYIAIFRDADGYAYGLVSVSGQWQLQKLQSSDLRAVELRTGAEETPIHLRVVQSPAPGILWAVTDGHGYTPIYCTTAGKTIIHDLEAPGFDPENIAALEELKVLRAQSLAAAAVASEAKPQLRSAYSIVREEAAVLRSHDAAFTTTGKAAARRPICVFTDDDFTAAVWTRLRPVFAVRGLACCTYGVVSGDRDFNPEYVRFHGASGVPRMLDLQANYNAEIASHSATHIRIHENSVPNPAFDFELEFAWSYEKLTGLGAKVKAYIPPFNNSSHAARLYLRRYYNCSSGNINPRPDNRLNYPPLHQYALVRYGIDGGAYVEDPENPGAGPTAAGDILDEWKARVDLAESTGALLIFTHHCGLGEWENAGDEEGYDPTWIAPSGDVPEGWRPQIGNRLHALWLLIEYIQGKGIPIMGMGAAMEAYGNLVDVGDYTGGSKGSIAADASDYPHFVTGVDGASTFLPIED
jgi:hypothetical protein